MKNNITKYIFIVGIIVSVIGFYASFFKAGLPYQDPTPEMDREWMFYYNFGRVAIPIGGTLVIIGAVLKIVDIVLKLFERLKKNNFYS